MPFKSSDPLKRLPYEIWIRAMQSYARDQPEGPLPLLAISSAWQRRILESPEIWTTIYFDGGEDEEARVECFFHLSKTFEVDLVLDRNSGSVNTAIKYRERIRTLVFRTKSRIPYSSDDVSRFAYRLADHRYPKLVHIHVEMPCAETVLIPRNLVEACPGLIGIHGGFIGQSDIPCILASTTMLGVFGDDTFSGDIGYQLEVLRVQRDTSAHKPGIHPKYFGAHTTHLSLLSLSSRRQYNAWEFIEPIPELPNLPSILPFVSVNHYGLKNLSVALMWSNIASIISHLPACPTLRELELILDLDPNLESLPINRQIGKINHIRTLTISGGLVTDPFYFQFQGHLLSLIQLLANADILRCLEELKWMLKVAFPTETEVLCLLRPAPSLKKLYLASGLPTMGFFKDFGVILLENLHTLAIQSLQDLNWLETPHLVSLECGQGLSFDLRRPVHPAGTLEFIMIPSNSMYLWTEQLVTKTTHFEVFTRLLKLWLVNDALPRTSHIPINFSNLRSISFLDLPHNSYRNKRSRAPLNHFMLDLLLFPDICPLLQEIEAHMYPSWALAAAMCYRRNSSNSVRPVLSLRLPRYPQIYILEVITRARGVVDESPRDMVSAAIGIDQIIKQRSITDFFRTRTCQYCVLSGYTVCGSKHRPFGSNFRASPIPTEFDDQAVMGIMDLEPAGTWTERLLEFTRDIWTAYLQERTTASTNLRNYVEHCPRHDFTNLVDIGPHTLTETRISSLAHKLKARGNALRPNSAAYNQCDETIVLFIKGQPTSGYPSSFPPQPYSSKLSHTTKAADITMAPTRNPSNPTPRAQAAPYQTRSRAINGTDPSNTSLNAGRGLTNDDSNDRDDGEGQDSYHIASGGREMCTKEQTDALEALFWSSKGYPTRADKEEVAARIGKSYDSTNIWMQNRRHPRDETRKPWFLIPGAIDPAIYPNAPLYPLEGVAHKPAAKKGKKAKRAVVSRISKRKASFKVTDKVAHISTSISTTAQPLNHSLANVPMHDSRTPERPNWSGDSNGSAISTPQRRSPPSDRLVEILPIEVSEGRPPLSKAQVVSILLGMKMAHGDPFDINAHARIGLQLTPRVLPISERYPESSVRLWSPPDAEVTSQATGLSH